jgi:hypothetical protein
MICLGNLGGIIKIQKFETKSFSIATQDYPGVEVWSLTDHNDPQPVMSTNFLPPFSNLGLGHTIDT